MSPAPLALWGGAECTVNRVGDRVFDQLHLTGHDARPDDLDRFAGLGLRKLRVAVLWERIETAPGVLDWRGADAMMARLNALDIAPIVGLVHHGSGPRWTDLTQPSFASGLAAHAARVADRYPWVRDWTPVNEPLTTARFSCLYGLWYPHLSEAAAFWGALLNQIEATALAMAAIRTIIPQARLIQTEDFGRTWATPPCQAPATFENDRRLMTWDLLCGRVDGT
ncbi:MAG: glycosyl hydrolase family protein, partial [Brevundimonas sp.]